MAPLRGAARSRSPLPVCLPFDRSHGRSWAPGDFKGVEKLRCCRLCPLRASLPVRLLAPPPGTFLQLINLLP